jgi:hypothetical protein
LKEGEGRKVRKGRRRKEGRGRKVRKRYKVRSDWWDKRKVAAEYTYTCNIHIFSPPSHFPCISLPSPTHHPPRNLFRFFALDRFTVLGQVQLQRVDVLVEAQGAENEKVGNVSEKVLKVRGNR